MRYYYVMIQTVLVFVFSFFISSFPAPVQAADMFSTVNADNWSYKAVKDLIQDGVIAGEQARFVNGSPISRYEMAILIANGMRSTAKASTEQMNLLDKLSKEFNFELMHIGAIPRTGPTLNPSDTPSPNLVPPPDKGPSPNPLNIMVESRFQFATTSLRKTDSGMWGGKLTGVGINDKSQFLERLRIYFNGAINNDWTWNARYNQQVNNINNGETPAKFDRFFVSGKNVFGGQLLLGKMPIAPGKGGIISYTGDGNGILYIRNIGDKVTMKIGDYREYFAPLIDNTTLPVQIRQTAQDTSYSEITWKPTKSSDIGVYRFRNNYNDAIHDTDVYAVFGATVLNNKKPTGLTFAFEAAKNHADDAPYKNKSGYILFLNSKYSASVRPPWNSEAAFKNMPVDPFKKGDSGWVLSYRHMPSGVSGFLNRASSAMVPLSTDTTTGMFQNGCDDINAFRLDYQYVPWKNIQWTVTYDRIKPTNGNWMNNSIQTALVYFFK